MWESETSRISTLHARVTLHLSGSQPLHGALMQEGSHHHLEDYKERDLWNMCPSRSRICRHLAKR